MGSSHSGRTSQEDSDKLMTASHTTFAWIPQRARLQHLDPGKSRMQQISLGPLEGAIYWNSEAWKL